MLWIVVGNQGGGKSIFLVKEAKKYYDMGMTVYSNIHLNFPYKKLKYEDIIECKYENAVVLIDEAHQLLGSRNSMSKVNNSITTSFCSMLRKKGITLLCSTQRTSKIDRRLRDECTFLVECDRYALQNNQWVHKPYDDKTTTRETPTIIKTVITDVNTLKTMNHCFIANEYYGLYNTKEIVLIEGLDEYFAKKEATKSHIKKQARKEMEQ